MMMNNDLKFDDILEFENGEKIKLSMHNHWVLEQYYDDDLKCITNPEYNVKCVYRPKYEKVFDRNEIKQR